MAGNTPMGRGRLPGMTDKSVLPYGSWPTPITSELVVRAAARLGEVAVDGDAVWWSEQRPDEGGRSVLVRDGTDILPPPWNARTAVHEYGGGAWWVRGGTVWFARWDDQRLYRLDPAGEPRPITPVPETPRGDRYADGEVHPDGSSLVCVREHHPAGGSANDVGNAIVRIPAAGGGPIEVLVSGPDFVSHPRWSPDGARLCWLEWDHPAMPWDGTRLLVDGEVVAGGPAESVGQPRWGPDGSLWFVSDRTGWWNLYRRPPTGAVEPVVVLDAEIGVPQWVFGLSPIRPLPRRPGRARLPARRLRPPRRLGRHHARRPRRRCDLDRRRSLSPSRTCCSSAPPRPQRPSSIGCGWTARRSSRRPSSAPPATSASTAAGSRSRNRSTTRARGGRTAHGLFYAPTSPTHRGPPAERPPLLVLIHGGPTSAARPMLDLEIQYWTSRGFAAVAVNYGGSTGYGRPYRELLQGRWGIVDVEDCEAAARWLADHGRADPDRLCITGGSAGGFTTLAALAGGDVFAAGASHYGVSDLEALAVETHKFESRYLDGLIGKYPEQRSRYVERSPIHHLDGFDRPLIVLQGLDDEVVPPSQSEMIVSALTDRGIPVAYVPFAGEQHRSEMIFQRSGYMRRVSQSGPRWAFQNRRVGRVIQPRT